MGRVHGARSARTCKPVKRGGRPALAAARTPRRPPIGPQPLAPAPLAPADRKSSMTDVTDAPIERDGGGPRRPRGRRAPVPSFSDFPIHADIVSALAKHNITSPFPIQAMTLPVALSGHDIIGQAKTGTGKTLGFGIPILNRVVAPATTPSPPCPTPASRRRWPSRPPASSPSRSPATSSAPAPTAASASSPSTAAAPTSRRSRPSSGASRSSSAPPAASSTSPSRVTSTSATPASSSSTRPTRCSTSASSPTSSASSR